MEVQPITADIQQPSEATAGEKMGGMTGKFKSLLGKAKQKPIEINSEVDEIKEPIIETDLPIAEIDLTSLSSYKNQEVGVTGRFKNPFRKTKQEPIEKEVDIVEVKEEIVTDTEQVSVSPVKQQGVGLTGKFKNLFGKAK
jgi:rubrerythrin